MATNTELRIWRTLFLVGIATAGIGAMHGVNKPKVVAYVGQHETLGHMILTEDGNFWWSLNFQAADDPDFGWEWVQMENSSPRFKRRSDKSVDLATAQRAFEEKRLLSGPWINDSKEFHRDPQRNKNATTQPKTAPELVRRTSSKDQAANNSRSQLQSMRSQMQLFRAKNGYLPGDPKKSDYVREIASVDACFAEMVRMEYLPGHPSLSEGYSWGLNTTHDNLIVLDATGTDTGW